MIFVKFMIIIFFSEFQLIMKYIVNLSVNPLTASPKYIRFFIFVSSHEVPLCKLVKEKM